MVLRIGDVTPARTVDLYRLFLVLFPQEAQDLLERWGLVMREQLPVPQSHRLRPLLFMACFAIS